MNPLAEQLNQSIKSVAPQVYGLLSDVGKKLFFPKGILSQSAEAKEKAHAINATIGIATEGGHTMRFDSVMASINNIRPSQSLTYAPSFGIPLLRKKWREELFVKNPSLAGKTVSLPVVTCGITHGIATFADVWINSQDVIILPDMMWGNYSMIFTVRKDACIRHYELFNTQGGFNLGALSKPSDRRPPNIEKSPYCSIFPRTHRDIRLAKARRMPLFAPSRISRIPAPVCWSSATMRILAFFMKRKHSKNPFSPVCVGRIQGSWP